VGFPTEKELKAVRRKLETAEPARVLPKSASKADRLKYELCKCFVAYLLRSGESQAELARKLKVDPSRVNEIVKYRIELYTVDKLLDLSERLNLNIEIQVA
jgi:predicted XRE-type DNA-binding protein